jgi:outer membrane protein assembly factor BamB
MLNKKIVAIAVTIIFILSLTGSIALAQITAIPGVSVGTHIPTYLYLIVGPDPIGVGQVVTLNPIFGSCIIDQEIPSVRDPWNYNVTVTSPSGRVETFTVIADKTGGGYYPYTPTEVGEYKAQASYGGQELVRPGWIGLIQDPAISEVVTFTVQEEPITQRSYPYTPLPTNYWQTPVSAQNSQNWYKIMGPMFFPGYYNSTTYANPYTEPVLSGHLLWTKPWIAGGVVGGEFAGGGEERGHYWTVRQYEQPFNPIIMNGRMWSEQEPQSSSSSNGILCVDLYTGETIYRIDTTNALYMGMSTPLTTPNMYGTPPYVIFTTGSLDPSETGGELIYSRGTQYNMYDGLTGIYILSIVNGSSLSVKDPDSLGNIVGWYRNNTVGTQYLWDSKPFERLLPNGTTISRNPRIVDSVNMTGQYYLCKFNFTKAIWNQAGTSGGYQIPANTAIDFSWGIEYVKPMPTELDGLPIVPDLGYTIIHAGKKILMSSFVYPAFYWTNGWDVIATFDEDTGDLSWIKNYTYPTYPWLLPWQDTWSQRHGMVVNGMLIQYELHDWNFQAIDTDTGNVVWTTQLTTGWGDGKPHVYGELARGIPRYLNLDDHIYIVTFAGEMWSLNANTGAQEWYTNTTNLMGPSGVETPYNLWPIWTAQNPNIAAPGVLYLGVSHQYNPPMFHGAQRLAVNMTDGSLVWKELAFPMPGQSLAYGILVSLNGYDGQIYAYGKGPSTTTVTAPDIGVTTATPITIRGTVMDVSAGVEQSEVAKNFAQGLPCMSDESQSHWMEFVYQNQPCPTDATGVVVTLSVEDANGNVYEIGTTTSDTSGSFGFTWTPIISGDYKVMATFAGSNSYYGSTAATHFYASEATQPTPEPTLTPESVADIYFLPMSIVTIILIAIVGAVLFLMLRKR